MRDAPAPTDHVDRYGVGQRRRHLTESLKGHRVGRSISQLSVTDQADASRSRLPSLLSHTTAACSRALSVGFGASAVPVPMLASVPVPCPCRCRAVPVPVQCPCRARAVPMPCPCRAGAVPVPCLCRAEPCRARAVAMAGRRWVGLPATWAGRRGGLRLNRAGTSAAGAALRAADRLISGPS